MKKPVIYMASAALAISTMLSGCGSTDSSSTTTSTTNNSTIEDTENTTKAPITSGDYQKYYDFILANCNNDNMIISSESLGSAFYTYSHLLDAGKKEELQKFLNNVDYSKYQNTDEFKLVNRIWANSNKDIHFDNTGVEDLVYNIDMSDSKAATNEKNEYVKENTNGFIEKTPTVFEDSVVIDVMNIAYFKDSWAGGKKSLSIDSYEFKNADGTTTETHLLEGFNGNLYKSDNAHCFVTNYSKGFEFGIILPDENFSINDIKVDQFISKEAELVTDCIGKVKFPEFDTLTDVQCNFADFNLSINNISKNVYDESMDSTIYQTARIKVDQNGTEAAAVTEVMEKVNGMLMEDDIYEMICDRPFVYYIYDTTNNDVAFMGVLNNLK